MEYNFREIEKKWQKKWIDDGAYKVSNESGKPKYYVLDMFPYPSGAGLHVGHPLGYIASDIYARYKRLKGFNVLHPMGYDAFGLPAEQYAIEHGVHPADSTAKNIATFRSQLDKIGFSYDWSREVNTSNPKYYKWTQWIFLQLFKSWYNRKTNKTESIDTLITIFEAEGNKNYPIPDSSFQIPEYPHVTFTPGAWNSFPEKTQQTILMEYRVAYCGYGEVNWCEALGTVLANDEVVNGVSERGGHPVVKKKLRQWYLRITEYADRLLQGLNTVDFSDAMKEMQTNWIGKSSGAEIDFEVSLTPNPSPLGEGGIDPEGSEHPETNKKDSGHYFQTADNTSWQTIKQYGRENRKNPTAAEDLLWQNLRNNKLDVKVRRQHSIKGYIVDFAILELNLVIEVDGNYHDNPEQQSLDLGRQTDLEQHDYTVLRFSNDDVLKNISDVLQKIRTNISQLQESKKLSETTSPISGRRGVGGEAILRVYTTRPDTIFGVDFMVIAPEHDLVEQIITAEQKLAVEEYIAYVKSRSERERMAEKKISGVFTGAYAVNPFDGRQIPIWISEYVLAGYGTGAIMAVPSGDERDHKFAKHFNIPITNIIGDAYNGEEANPTKDAVLSNSGFINGMVMRDAIDVVINKLEELGIGKRKVNYKMRDAAFSRQRYWGEPFPIKWIDGVAYPLDENELPLELPHVEKYGPGAEGEGPLANVPEWTAENLETNTMPGYAGSSWYFLRYMDPHNDETFADKKVSSYWNQVDLYVGGTEHAVGHLLYSRMWTKALYDLGLISFDEPFKKLLNQGMIQGSSRFIYRVTVSKIENADNEIGIAFTDLGTPLFISYNYVDGFERMGFDEQIEFIKANASDWDGLSILETEKGLLTFGLNELRVDVNIVNGNVLDLKELKRRRPEFEKAKFILYYPISAVVDGSGEPMYLCGSEVEKMSKSKYNTVNPDHIVDKYGADTFRMYEMFLGPVEMSKPWDTKGIEGVHRFLKKLWRLFFNELKGKLVTQDKATPEELKVLHRTIKKIQEDTERFSYNTAVSAFMVCVNELTDLKCHKKEVLEQLLILLTPYAPHVSEELWHELGHDGSILDATYPTFNPAYLVESTKEYPVSINGKLRTTLVLDLNATQEQVQEIVVKNEVVKKWIEDKPVKKFIFVKGKMVNIVI
jgi:leucyl-tRNA synthetase